MRAVPRPGRFSGLKRTRVARVGRTFVMAIWGPSPARAARQPALRPALERGARAWCGRTPSRGGCTRRNLGVSARITRTHHNHLLRSALASELKLKGYTGYEDASVGRSD